MDYLIAYALDTMVKGHVPIMIRHLVDTGLARPRGEGIRRHYIVTDAGRRWLVSYRNKQQAAQGNS